MFLLLSVNSEGNTSSSRTTDTKVPTVELIKDLERDNVYWTAEQLDQMSTATFTATAETLGNIPDFSSDQLAILSKNAREVNWSHQKEEFNFQCCYCSTISHAFSSPHVNFVVDNEFTSIWSRTALEEHCNTLPAEGSRTLFYFYLTLI